MSITDELREWASVEVPYKYGHQLNAIADSIDAKHERLMAERRRSCVFYDAERNYCKVHDEGDMAEPGYVRLPKDADGVPIHAGDTLDGYGKTIEVVEMRHGRGGWVLISRDGNGYADTFAFAHHHEPTVEDVLRDVVTLCHNTWKAGSAFEFYDVDDVMESGNIAEYAATLGSCNCTNGERTNGTWSDFDMQMAYHMGYDDALARRKPDAGKVVTNG